MKLTLIRKYKKDTYTVGNLYIDGEWFCNTLEDKDRGLSDDMPLEVIKAKKLYGVTAIPYGTYKVDMNTVSPKYAKKNCAYSRTYGHKMPRLLNIKAYDGVLIHPGNTANDTLGCILVGENKVKGKIINSQSTWKRLMERLITDKDNISIEIRT